MGVFKRKHPNNSNIAGQHKIRHNNHPNLRLLGVFDNLSDSLGRSLAAVLVHKNLVTAVLLVDTLEAVRSSAPEEDTAEEDTAEEDTAEEDTAEEDTAEEDTADHTDRLETAG
ncbi:hypothetical protein RUND412_008746 [Rhizina undulata]